MKAFIIIILTIGLIYIRNWLADNSFFKRNKSLTYLLFCFVVIMFMFIMSGVQGSSFMSLITLIIIITSLNKYIYFFPSKSRTNFSVYSLLCVS